MAGSRCSIGWAITRGRLVVVGLVLAGCEVATIRPLDPATGRAIIADDAQVFDPHTFVAERWDSHVLAAAADAAPLRTLIATLEADPESARERYGRRAGSGPSSFLVTGTARVLEVDTASGAGVAVLDVEPYDGVADARLQIGPVIVGTALRDALSFIQFGDFANQMEYAAVSRMLHEHVLERALGGIDRGAVQGAILRFRGAFTHQGREPLITPVTLEIGG